MGNKAYPVDNEFAKHAHVNAESYRQLYQQSVLEPDSFWTEHANQFIDWISPWHRVSRQDFRIGEVAWFEGGELNASVNCIDRHLESRANQIAIIWEGDDPEESLSITYAELHERVCRLANVLLAQGVERGDRVCIYLPMIPEAAYAMLACARIGAVHSVVFGGF